MDANCDPDSVAGCFEGRAMISCDSAWDAIEACANPLVIQLFQFAGINNRADYVRVCEEQFAANPMQVELDIQCFVDASSNGMCDAQLQCLLGGFGP
jgi:hypothetical protein